MILNIADTFKRTTIYNKIRVGFQNLLKGPDLIYNPRKPLAKVSNKNSFQANPNQSESFRKLCPSHNASQSNQSEKIFPSRLLKIT